MSEINSPVLSQDVLRFNSDSISDDRFPYFFNSNISGLFFSSSVSIGY